MKKNVNSGDFIVAPTALSAALSAATGRAAILKSVPKATSERGVIALNRRNVESAS